jgi:hypothetical protein
MNRISLNKCRDCGIRAIYNFEGSNYGIYCNNHRKVGMRDVLNMMCQHDGCKTRPTFNMEGQLSPLYCSKHRLPR